jgi:hypothetical protein
VPTFVHDRSFFRDLPARRYLVVDLLYALAVVIPQRQPDSGLLLGTWAI